MPNKKTSKKTNKSRHTKGSGSRSLTRGIRASGKKITVVVSGGFDPIHIGHVRLFKEARALGDYLVVILNNDNWIRAKKEIVFTPQAERKEIIESLGCVDEVVLTQHSKNTKDMSVSKALRRVRPDIFANGGDRPGDEVREVFACKEIGCRTVFGIGHGGKIQSSSWLLKKYISKIKKTNKP